MKTKSISYLFFFVAGLNVVAQLFSNADLNQYTKPLLMPLLIYYVYHTAQGRVTIQRLLATGALIFSWIGDLLLLYPERNWNFLGGLAAFLVAQVIYAVALNKAVYQKLTVRMWPLIPLLLYGIALLAVILPNTGSLSIPVAIYGVCIVVMVGSARLRHQWTTNESYNLCLYGAILFLLSDSVLAYNKFVAEVPYASLWIMLTYIGAQYLLVRGILAHPA